MRSLYVDLAEFKDISSSNSSRHLGIRGSYLPLNKVANTTL